MTTMTVYKLTDAEGKTYGGCQWGENVTHEASGTGFLCTSGWIHCYDSPFLAVLMNPIHWQFENPRLWECVAKGKTLDDNGLKRGVQCLTTLREIPLPIISDTQRIAFAILCAMEVCADAQWREWREWGLHWLDGTDRSLSSTLSATADTAYAAYSAAASAASHAAYSAAAAAYSVAHSAANAAYSAAYATYSAANTADSAANAAHAALDWNALINKAMSY